MNYSRAVLLVFALFLSAPTVTAQSSIEQEKGGLARRILGTWTLISIEDADQNGRTLVPPIWARNPVGALTYGADGHMAVQIMNTARQKFASGSNERATADEKAAAYDSYLAYFGTYEVNEKNFTVAHHLKGSLFPDETGTDKVRRIEFSGERLILTLLTEFGGQRRTRRLVWERAK